MDTVALLAIIGGLGLLGVGIVALMVGGVVALVERVVKHCRSVSYDTRNTENMPDPEYLMDPITGHMLGRDEL